MPAILGILLVTGGLFLAFLTGVEVGFRLGARDRVEERSSITVVVGAVFGLLALLLAFTFGTGIAHYDHRRQLVVDETKAIGTAYLRIGLLPPNEQSQMRALFRRYIDARLAVYQGDADIEVREIRFGEAEAIEQQIWSVVVRTPANARPDGIRLLVPALNDMFNVEMERKIAASMHNPTLVLVLLIVVGLMSSVLAGYTMVAHGTRPVLLMVIYPMMLALTIYTVIDLDHPRSGIIRLDAADQALIQLRDSMDTRAPSR